MWSRSELKEKAKGRFKANYWKAVFVSLVLAVAIGGSYGGAGNNAHENAEKENMEEEIEQEARQQNDDWVNVKQGSTHEGKMVTVGIAVVTISLFAIIMLVILIIIIPLQVFLLNPLEVGCKRFYLKNGQGQAQVKEVAYAFDHGYLNIIKTLFFRDLFFVLWLLLLVVPGIMKYYEYRMIPYILSENPQMPREQAFALSKKMMSGNKWRAFVLDLSFIGWYILNVLTVGIAGIFYINPYKDQTDAGLYEVLKEQ